MRDFGVWIGRRLRRRMARILAGAMLAAFGLIASALGGLASREPARPSSAIAGRASVVDGDTIRIGAESIRINGVDAPESRQTCQDAAGRAYPCGRRAAEALDDFLAKSRPTTCAFVERDRYGRFVGRCARADGADVAAFLVRNGLAVEWKAYSHGRYAQEEAAARRQGAGVWQGAFDFPWDWRAAHGRGSASGG